MRSLSFGAGVIELADGRCYTYNPSESWRQTFTHASACAKADHAGEPRPPAPPLIIKALARAKDRETAVGTIWPSWRTKAHMCAYSLHALVEHGVLEHKAFAAGYPPVAPLPEDSNGA
jgi:hypothetical protein